MKLHSSPARLSSYEDATSLFPSTSDRRAPPPLSEATVFAIRRLQRIQGLIVHTPTTSNGHRVYVVEVARKLVRPSGFPTYQVRLAAAALRDLRTQLQERTTESRTNFQCPVCTMLMTALTMDHVDPGRLRTLTEQSKKQDAARVEAMLAMLLDHTLRTAAPTAVHCVGCEWTVKLVAELLHQPYEQSTGLI